LATKCEDKFILWMKWNFILIQIKN
jgi:hypothetical protein